MIVIGRCSHLQISDEASVQTPGSTLPMTVDLHLVVKEVLVGDSFSRFWLPWDFRAKIDCIVFDFIMSLIKNQTLIARNQNFDIFVDFCDRNEVKTAIESNKK